MMGTQEYIKERKKKHLTYYEAKMFTKIILIQYKSILSTNCVTNYMLSTKLHF